MVWCKYFSNFDYSSVTKRQVALPMRRRSAHASDTEVLASAEDTRKKPKSEEDEKKSE